MLENIKLDEVKTLIEAALQDFYREDFVLLDYKTEDDAVSERCAVFHIGWHLLNHLKRDVKTREFSVDSEYNRCFGHPKSMYAPTAEGIRKKIGNAYPDLIIHRRKSNEQNLVIIEFKKHGTYEKGGRDSDFKKLKYFTNQQNEYKFKYGFWIVLYKKKKADIQKESTRLPSSSVTLRFGEFTEREILLKSKPGLQVVVAHGSLRLLNMLTMINISEMHC